MAMTPAAAFVPLSLAPLGATLDSPVKMLARRAGAGDHAAAAALLHAVRPGVVAVVRRIVGARPADVDDAIQLSLIAFVEALPAYRGESEPSAYAKAIAVRTAIALRKRERRAANQSDFEADFSTIPSQAPSPNEDAIAAKRRAFLRQLLCEIPTEQAEALTMRVVLGWSIEEIATHAAVPVNTVRSRIRLAKHALQKKIAETPSVHDALDVADRKASRYPLQMSEPRNDDDVIVERESKVAKARRYAVVFYNDDYTTKWFVVMVLEQFFHMSETAATSFMMAVHRHGKGVAGVYTRDIAETKAAQITDVAMEYGMPLKVAAEPDEHGDDE